MNADQLSYKRATSVSLLGLAIQTVLATTLIVYARLGSDPAAFSAGIAMFLGLPVWATLTVVFYQHKLERIEALEAELYAGSSVAEASVFEESGSDLNVQASKLTWLHKWFLPFVSLVVGVTYVALGLLRFPIPESNAEEIIYAAPPETGWAIAIGVGIAAIGFVFARFVAGMAKQNVWMLLHAGSATSVLAALLGGLIAVAHFLHAAIQKDFLLELLPTVIPVVMVALGVEIFLNFVLNLYRPRTAGQTMRPAFDSRVLAFVAAPDRLAKSVSGAINYQFGFNVSSTWFYRLLSRLVLTLVVLCAALIWAMSSVVIVQPGERGVVVNNGRFVREVGPGPVFKAPWPISRVVTFPAESVNEFVIGEKVEEDGPILWTKSHSANPLYVIVQPTSVVAEENDSRASVSLLVAEIPVHYVVRNGELRSYLDLAQDGPSSEPDRMRREFLRSLASRIAIEHLSTLRVDEAVGAGRISLAIKLREKIQLSFDEYNAGVHVTFVGIAGLHPNEDVAPSFEKLVASDQVKQAATERAQANSIRQLATVAGEVEKAERILEGLDRLDALEKGRAAPSIIAQQEQEIMALILEAGGKAAELVAEARADRWTKHMSARSRLASSTGQNAMFRAAPEPYLASLLVKSYRDFASRANVHITPLDLRLEINQEQEQAAISGYTEAIQDPEDQQQ